MENVVKEESKKKNLIIGVLIFVIVLLLVTLVYFVFIKKDNTSEPAKPQDNMQVNDEQYIAMLNDGLRNLLFQELTQDEFRNKAKQYCTDELITNLLEYYNNDTSSVCLNAGGCSVDGGYIGEVTDIYYRDFRIVSKNDTIIEGIGIYGESKDNVKEQTIRYKLDNGTWKIDDFDINRY